VLIVAACSSVGQSPRPTRPDDRVVVASFNFDESRLLAEIYAQALEDAGIAVRRELDLGPREIVLPAMRQGLVDVVPEYLGALLDAAVRTPGAAEHDPQLAARRLGPVLARWGLRVLEPSAASNQNTLAVTRETADELHLVATSDLRPFAPDLVAGGPPECATRPRCLPGLETTYGVRFAAFVPIQGARLVEQALLDEVIDVGVLFTTDGELAGDDLVALTDDRALQPAENVVPLVRTEGLAAPGATTVLDEISARLTTAGLRFLAWRVTVAGGTLAAEARGWLLRQGLVDRS
jgi:osmoprotectant transport system substrate-binding protein